MQINRLRFMMTGVLGWLADLLWPWSFHDPEGVAVLGVQPRLRRKRSILLSQEEGEEGRGRCPCMTHSKCQRDW